MTLSLGISPCPNDVYIFSGLLLGKSNAHGVTFDSVAFEDVETLNALSATGNIAVCKISYGNYLRVAGDYELLPCGGALGRGVGPLLLTNGNADGFDPRREILMPGEWTTANFLLDFYLRQTGTRKLYLSFDELYDRLCNQPGVQGVVIHEKRFTYAADGLTLVRDLGLHYEAETGHAIPLGAIAVRRDLGADMIARVTKAVRGSLAWADANRAEAFDLCRHYASDLSDGVIEAHIALYVNEYSHDLGDDGREAVRYFLQAAKQKL